MHAFSRRGKSEWLIFESIYKTNTVTYLKHCSLFRLYSSSQKRVPFISVVQNDTSRKGTSFHLETIIIP